MAKRQFLGFRERREETNQSFRLPIKYPITQPKSAAIAIVVQVFSRTYSSVACPKSLARSAARRCQS
jgi:hypothetical protein